MVDLTRAKKKPPEGGFSIQTGMIANHAATKLILTSDGKVAPKFRDARNVWGQEPTREL
jgi:hypothetical protein